MDRAALDLCRTAREIGLVADWRQAPGLGAILVSGPDAGNFLQSQLTSDVLSLAGGQGQPSARLTRTGALVAHFALHRLPERGQPFAAYLLLLPAAEISSLLEDLLGCVVGEDIQLEDAGQEFQGLVVQGPLASSLLEDLGDDGEVMILQQSFTGDPGWVGLAAAHRPSPWATLHQAALRSGFANLDEHGSAAAAWDWLRLEAGRPLAGADFRPGKTTLPQTGLDQQAVSTTKGCYLGQEVIARLRAYGSVPRALRGLIFHEPLSLQPEQLPPAGHSLLTAAGDTIGTWASAGYSVVWDRPAAMVYLDRDHRTPGRRLTLELSGLELEAEVVLLPFFAAASSAERAAALHDRAVRRFSAGADREALDLLEEALRLDPKLTGAYEAFGVILGRSERYHEAIDVFKRLEEVAPDEPMVHTNLSLFYMKIGDKDEAERQKALATLKKFGGALSEAELAERDRVEKASRQEDARRRRTMFAEVLAVDPQDGLALMGMGNALLDLEEPGGAEEYLARALLVQKDNSPLYVSRGKVLEMLGRTGEAAEVYRAGVEVASRKGDLMPLKELEHRLFLLGPS